MPSAITPWNSSIPGTESERGMPGPPFEDDPVDEPPPKEKPPPPPPAAPVLEEPPPRVPGFNPADGLLLLKRWDKEQDQEQDCRFWFLLGGYRSRAGTVDAEALERMDINIPRSLSKKRKQSDMQCNQAPNWRDGPGPGRAHALSNVSGGGAGAPNVSNSKGRASAHFCSK